MSVEPDDAQLAEFAREAPTGPVVMLNLLKFAEGGVALYREYGRHLRDTFLPRYGAKVLYAGTASTPLVAHGPDWDAVVVVWYPDRGAFLRMIADPEYLAVAHLREKALSAAVLQATTPWR